MGGKHQVELSDFGPVRYAGIRRFDFFVEDDLVQCRRHVIGMQGLDEALVDGIGPVCSLFLAEPCDVVLNELVGAVPVFGDLVVDEGITEGIYVPRGFPDGRVHQDGGIYTGHVCSAGHGLPPPVLDVVLEFYAQRPVIIRGPQAAVDFGGAEDKPAPLAQGNDLV